MEIWSLARYKKIAIKKINTIKYENLPLIKNVNIKTHNLNSSKKQPDIKFVSSRTTSQNGSTHLINDVDNEKIYYGRVSDELLRYKFIRDFSKRAGFDLKTGTKRIDWLRHQFKSTSLFTGEKSPEEWCTNRYGWKCYTGW